MTYPKRYPSRDERIAKTVGWLWGYLENDDLDAIGTEELDLIWNWTERHDPILHLVVVDEMEKRVDAALEAREAAWG